METLTPELYYSRCIKKVFYEADTLSENENYESWKDRIFSYYQNAEAKEVGRFVSSQADVEAPPRRCGPGLIDGYVYGYVFSGLNLSNASSARRIVQVVHLK